MLLFEGFLHLADYPLNLPRRLFNRALGFQTAIIRQLAFLLPDLALHFVKQVFRLAVDAGFNLLASWAGARAAAPVRFPGESAHTSLLGR